MKNTDWSEFTGMSDKRKTTLILVCLAAIAAVKIAFSFVPEGRFWGLNQLAYYPYPVRIFFVGLFLAVTLMCLNKKAINRISDLYNNIQTVMQRIPIIPRTALYLGFLFVIFYLFRDSTNLLGDGLLRIGELQNKRLENFLSQHSTEPLDYLIHYFIYTVFLAPFKIKPIISYQLLSAFAGIIYIYTAYFLSRKLNHDGGGGFVFWYIIGWGGLMLFFGYIESYALAASISIIFLGYSYILINGQGDELVLAFLYLLAFFMHNATIVYFPAIVYLIFIKSNSLGIRRLITPGIIVLAVIAWISIGIVHRQSAGLLLTGNLSEPGYTIFSLAHLGDIINEIFLISPAFFVLICLQNWRGDGNGSGRNFFGLAAIGGLIFLLLADPVLGLGRDWDLFALPILGLHIGLLVGIDWERVDNRIKTAILILLIFSTGTWIGVNSQASSSIERYKNIAGLDTVRSRYAFERLGTYLLLNKSWQKAEEVYRLSLQKEPHYRTYLGLAYVQAQMGQSDSAETNYEKALKLNPDQALALYSLCQAYLKEGKIIRARELFDRLRRVSSTGIVHITEKGIKDLEENLLRAEQTDGGSIDTTGIR